ncbi:hypothetical protein C0J52_25669 [Blattella germanica]|nr:hypothetical protein C0J52_25669 [Blattella germanica]
MRVSARSIVTGVTAQMSPGLTSPEYQSSPATSPPSLPPTRSRLGNIDDKLPPSSSASNTYTLNGSVRKDHIISNSIPGPESCV